MTIIKTSPGRLCHAGLRLFAFLIAVSANVLMGEDNLCRNGSFEGSLLYWHNVDPASHTLVDQAKCGQRALRIGEGYVMSAPVVCRRGERYTISLWARSETPTGRVAIGMPPSAREVGQKSGRLWTAGASQSVDLTDRWQRVSVTFTADVPPNGFWPMPHYMITIGGGKPDAPILIDGVNVTGGDVGTDDYVPRRDIEVLAECLNLPGYKGAAANVFDQGAEVQIQSHLSNPTAGSQTVISRLQWFDYEGINPLGPPADRTLTLDAGEHVAYQTNVPLTSNGCVIARVSAIDQDGDVIDSSDFPITSLPYPKAATVPDGRERFGGSFAGGVGCLDKFQRVGFGWSRWHPETKWHNIQPDGPETFDWHDEGYRAAWDRGISCHVVLYGWPEWIMKRPHPLPTDMRWSADDTRWTDLSIQTAWDRYVHAAVDHFRGKPVVFQIANEPGHDDWGDYIDEYVQFNLRTAALIKQVDADAKVSLNNVYLNPSPPNAALLRSGKLHDFDVWSWHDYHAGWLTDADGMKRVRSMLDNAGGQHMEIWFTEGWAFTNTLVDQPIACTSLTSAQSTNAIMDCVAEITATGQDKTILFHTAYEGHGMSFWDHSGPGTMLWDWYDNPLPLVAAWNVLNHHIGLSERVGLVQPAGCNLAIFDDLRNDRGVIVAYADRGASEDVTVTLPPGDWVAEDIMGHPVILQNHQLALSQSGRAVILHAADATAGGAFFAALEPLDRRHAGFVNRQASGKTVYQLPLSWVGDDHQPTASNPLKNGDAPVWRLDHVYPVDALMPENYRPMVWTQDRWKAPDHSQGGHPSAQVKNGDARFGIMGPWGGDQNYQKVGVLSFIAPADGRYEVRAGAMSEPWNGKRPGRLEVRKMDTQRAGVLATYDLPAGGQTVPVELEVDLAAGHELLFLFSMPHHNNASNMSLTQLRVSTVE